MKTCPNLSLPEIADKWKSIVDTPGLGRVEAMREYLEAEQENRPMGDAQQVKLKLAERYRPLSQSEINAINTKESNIIKSYIGEPLAVITAESERVNYGIDTEVRSKYFADNGVSKLNDVLEKISVSNHPLAPLAKKLMTVSKYNNIDIELEPYSKLQNKTTERYNTNNTGGLYYPIENEISIAEFANFRNKSAEKTILHEILHALSFWQLHKNGSDEQLSDFKKLFQYANDKLDVAYRYGLTNIDEFFVALFTDSALIKELQEIKPLKNTKEYKNLWEELLDYILNILNIKKGNSLYKQAFALATNVLDDNYNMQKADEEYELYSQNMDPTFTDPDSLEGVSLLLNPFNGKDFGANATDNTRAIEFIRKFSAQLNAPYAIVSPQQAVELTGASLNPYVIGKSPSFFYEGTVYFITGALTTNMVFHEFAHPVIKAMAASNPVLFEKLYNTAILTDPNLLDEAYAEYLDLRSSIEKEENLENKEILKAKYESTVKQEVLVKAMTKIAQMKLNNEVVSSGFAKFINDLLYSIKQFLRKTFGQKINISKLDVSTSLNALVDMLTEGGNFEINTNLITDSDVVNYIEANQQEIDGVIYEDDQAKKNQISTLTNNAFKIVKDQLQLLFDNGNFSEIKKILENVYGASSLSDISYDLYKYQGDSVLRRDELSKELINLKERFESGSITEKNYSELIIEAYTKDINKTENNVEALANTLNHVEKVVTLLNKKLVEINKDSKNATPEEHQANLNRVDYFKNFLDSWLQYLNLSISTLKNIEGGTNNPMFLKALTIQSAIETGLNDISNISTAGANDILWEELKDFSVNADIEFNNIITHLKNSPGRNQSLINAKFIEYYGLDETEYNDMLDLKDKLNRGLTLTYEESNLLNDYVSKNETGAQLTKEKLKSIFNGSKDANYSSGFLRGYMYSSDPVLAGFAKYYKRHMFEVDAEVQVKADAFITEIDKLRKEANINFSLIGAYGKKLGFVDEYGGLDADDNFIIEKKWTLLSEYKGFNAVIFKFDHDIEKAQLQYDRQQDDESRLNLAKAKQAKQEHANMWMQQEFVDGFYEKDKIFNKYPNDVVGTEAQFRRDELLKELKSISGNYNDDVEDESILDEREIKLSIFWNKWRLMHSLKNSDNTFKTDSYVNAEGLTITTNEKSIAERLIEYRNESSKYYEWTPKKGGFQKQLKLYEASLKKQLIDEEYTEGSDGFNELFNAGRTKWIEANSVIKVKASYYEYKKSILDEISRILSKLSDEQKKAIDQSPYWEIILDAVNGHRDDNGQPIGNDVTGVADVKAAQEAIKKANAEWAGKTGLSSLDYSKLQELYNRKDDLEDPLSREEELEFNRLQRLKQKYGLNKIEKERLKIEYDKLKNLTEKNPTNYYLETINQYLENVDNTLYDTLGITEITEENINYVLTEENLELLFNQTGIYEEAGNKFRTWFEENHIESTFKNKKQYERLYIWTKTMPSDPELYLENTEIKDDAGNVIETIYRVPKQKYSNRVVKKQYRTGYTSTTDPTTGVVTERINLIIGKNIDNSGNFLPKDLINSPYRNEDYYKLQIENPKLFNVLEKTKEYFLKFQEKKPQKSRLYLQFPRFPKSDLELVQTMGARRYEGEKKGFVQQIIQKFKDFFYGSVYDFEKGMNPKLNTFNSKNIVKQLVKVDRFNVEKHGIPISGLSNMTVDETSTDIFTSMLRYMQSLEIQQKLIELNPVAQAIRKNLNKDEAQSILDKVNESNNSNRNLFGSIASSKNKTGNSIRKLRFEQFYEREFLGESNAGWAANSPFAQNITNLLFKQASTAFFALNITSAVKNALGARFQSLIEAVVGKYYTPKTYVQGSTWASKTMAKISTNIYTGAITDVDLLLVELLDPEQGRHREKLGTRFTRTLGKDTIDRSWLTSFRKWTQANATLSVTGAMLYKQKVMKGNQEIALKDAFEVLNGRLQLKADIDPEWGIIYDTEGNVTIGKKLNDYRNTMHMVTNKIVGAVGKFDQPGAKRFLLYKYASFMRGYFTEMFMDRFGKKMMNIGLNANDEGYYKTVFDSIVNTIRSGSFSHMGSDQKRAWIKTTAELALLIIIGLISRSIFGGFDPDDDDRYAKLKKKTGPLHIFGVSDEEDDFNLVGFLEVHSMLMLMQIKAENEQFVPFPGFGMNQLTSMVDIKSIAFGPTLDLYKSIGSDLVNYSAGKDQAYYERRLGPYEWQQEGSFKLWSHIAKMYGFNASNISPVDALKNFQSAQQLSYNR